MKFKLPFSKVQLLPNLSAVSIVFQARPDFTYNDRRLRLRRLTVSGTVDPTNDVNVFVAVVRRLPTAGGSFSELVAGADVARPDPGSVEFAGAVYHKALSLPELLPTNALLMTDFYVKRGFVVGWSRRDARLFTASQPLEIVAMPRANVDVELTGTIDADII